MTSSSTEIRVRGRDIIVPCIDIEGVRVISSGKFLRTARLFDEELLPRSHLPHPDLLIPRLKAVGMKADLYTFAERLPIDEPRFPYRTEFENWAVADIYSFDQWWANLPQESRKNARAAEKRGLEVRQVPFDEMLVAGIKHIYDETPIRQGRKFWHYGKSVDSVRKENSTYLQRSTFIGAFAGTELIAFIKYVAVDEYAYLIQILARNEHRDKKPMNALLAKTVAVCAHNGLTHLVYGQYDYGIHNDSSLTEFKRRNGFTKRTFPRYYIPLSSKGRLTILAGLHQGWRKALPAEFRQKLVGARRHLLQWKSENNWA